MSRVISLKEVEQHKERDSVWIVLHNQVYDVTKFLAEHPGGEEVLLDVAGDVATESFEDVGHSEDARSMLADFKIGDLAPEDRVEREDPATRAAARAADVRARRDAESTPLWAVAVPIILGVIAFLVWKYRSDAGA